MNIADNKNNPLSRQEWMRLLALASEEDILSFMRPFAESLSYSFLRKPESGMLMVEGRTGATRFNLGEVLITRCAVALANNKAEPAEHHIQHDKQQGYAHGYAWISGNKPEHAALAALCDALMQLPEYNQSFSEKFFPLLSLKETERLRAAEQEIAPTRVEFFTMVRGEDA